MHDERFRTDHVDCGRVLWGIMHQICIRHQSRHVCLEGNPMLKLEMFSASRAKEGTVQVNNGTSAYHRLPYSLLLVHPPSGITQAGPGTINITDVRSVWMLHVLVLTAVNPASESVTAISTFHSIQFCSLPSMHVVVSVAWKVGSCYLSGVGTWRDKMIRVDP